MSIRTDAQIAYVAAIRRKLGEFLLVIRDLLDKKVLSNDNFGIIPDKESIKNIIKAGTHEHTSNWGDFPEAKYLAILLYNNGYPVQIIAKSVDTIHKFPSNEVGNYNATYKMYIVHTNVSGEEVEIQNLNHFTLAIPNSLKDKFLGNINLSPIDGNKVEIENVEMTKYEIPGDGHCFYTSIATWCVLYGLADDLVNLSYNVPFEFNEVAHKQNLKVNLNGYTDETANIPKPMNLPVDFKKDSLTIANNMINKIKEDDFKPIFENEENITNSQEYEEYIKKIANDPIHCNKYKGNKEQEEQEEE